MVFGGWLAEVFSGVLLDAWLAACISLGFQYFPQGFQWWLASWLAGCLPFTRFSMVFLRFSMVSGSLAGMLVATY